MLTFEVDSKRLFSVFQPIYSFSNQACIGVEALIRGQSVETGESIPVYECLSYPNDLSRKNFTRAINNLHLRNWQKRNTPENWIFLNLDFKGLNNIDELCLEELIKEVGLDGHQVVVEVVESEISDEKLLEDLITLLRSFGCLIALDDFGAGHSNIDRIWKVEPDIVKLDRQVLLEATKSTRSESVLRNLTSLIQQYGSICLIEGVETKEQALVAMDAGVDLVQGFYFAKPQSGVDNIVDGEKLVKEITSIYPSYRKEREFVRTIQKKGYEALFENIFDAIDVVDMEEKMLITSDMSFVKRFFILDAHGYQVSDEYPVLDKDGHSHDVLKKGKGLCWKNRRYFIKAQQAPNDIYVSKPYRSLVDVELCLTISKVIKAQSGEIFVACFDVFYHDKSISSVQISV